MAFESLTDKLQNVFKKLRSKGRLTEEDVKLALKEVKMALLEADVNFKVVKQFTKSVQEQAIGQDVMSGLNPGQMVIKIVNDELVKLMGSETTELPLRPGNEITVFMMAGLQGASRVFVRRSGWCSRMSIYSVEQSGKILHMENRELRRKRLKAQQKRRIFMILLWDYRMIMIHL